MNRINQSSTAERLAVSFPMALTAAGLIGYIAQSLIRNQKQQSSQNSSGNRYSQG